MDRFSWHALCFYYVGFCINVKRDQTCIHHRPLDTSNLTLVDLTLRTKCPNTDFFFFFFFLIFSDTILDWFKQMKNKHLHKSAAFDMKEFYPSIKECLLKNAVNFVGQHTEISEKDKAVIFHARKSLLFNGQHVWIKRKGGLFEVTMGAFDGAEVCEDVGNFLLYQLLKNYNKKDIGLYRDDGLAICKNVSGSKAQKIKKDIQKLFKDNHLNITIQCILKIVNYLDVTFNLSNATCRPFCKPNNVIAYIHKESNHPPSILKQNPYISNLVFLNVYQTNNI